MEKLCRQCGQTKPHAEYYRDKSRGDGLTAYCKPCHAAISARPPRRVPPAGLKWCGTCKQDRPLDQFYRDPKQYDGLMRRCKSCCLAQQRAYQQADPAKNAERSREWRAANPRLAKDHKLKSTYGVPLGWYALTLARQNGRCAICQTTEPGGKGDFHLDHCHETNTVRGLLCGNCNNGIGHLKHSIDILCSAIQYLTERR